MLESEHQLIGTWLAEAMDGPPEPGYLRFTEDRRFLQFFDDPPRPSEPKYWTMRMWWNLEEVGILRLRPRRNDAGWTRGVHFVEDDLIISSVEGQPPKRWKCIRVPDEYIPAWFEERCVTALGKPWRK